MRLVIVGLFAAVQLAGLAPAPAGAAESVLQAVRERGHVSCAIGDLHVGDTRVGASGYEGFFPEFCRVVALALFDDREAVELSPTLIRHGLASIAAGEVDIYVANVTWTFSRDMELGLTPAAVLYYDGQGFLSHRGLVEGAVAGLQEATVCVSHSTTTIGNLEDFIALNGLDWEVMPFESSQGRNDAFFARRCELLTADRLVLASLRAAAVDDPAQYVLHEEVISKEPLVAYVRARDMAWGNVVRWAILATLLAEEKGVTRDNYREHLESPDPAVRRLLGVDPMPGTAAAGLDPAWPRRVVAGAGHYGEIFERHLGRGSPLGIERGLNRLWRDGGLLYAPPLR
jgi:general L-amino acid transport system substrate-binding protein